MEKRDRIIDAALKLFVEYCFHRTATSKIAQEAGVANGTLFKYFKTKDELVIALYIQFKEELAEFVANNTVNKAEKKETIKTQVLSTLYWALDNTTKFRFIQEFNTSPYIGQVERAMMDKQAEPHLMFINEGIKQGVLKPLPADLIYLLVSNQVFGLYQFLETENPSKVKQHELIQTTFDLLWDMIT